MCLSQLLTSSFLLFYDLIVLTFIVATFVNCLQFKSLSLRFLQSDPSLPCGFKETSSLTPCGCADSLETVSGALTTGAVVWAFIFGFSVANTIGGRYSSLSVMAAIICDL